MVAGNAAIIPNPIWNIFSPIETLTATLGIEMGEVSVGSDHYNALFAVAVVLLLITLIINLSAVAILRYLHEGRRTRPWPETFHHHRCNGLDREDRKSPPCWQCS